MFYRVIYWFESIFTGRSWWFWIALTIIAAGVGWLFYVS
jgi:hypothetical protein